MFTMFFFLLGTISSANPEDIVIDEHSNSYKDNYKVLFSVFHNQKVVNILDSVVEIYGKSEKIYAFYTCKSVKNVTFTPNSLLETIGSYAFLSCNIEYLDLSPCSHLNIIKNNAFHATKLISIKFPSSLKTIENTAFGWCYYLLEVEIPKSVTKLGSAFCYCNALSKITIEDGSQLKEISGEAIIKTNITSFRVPASFTKFRHGLVINNKNLETIEVESNETYVVEDNLLYTSNMKTLVFCPEKFYNRTVYIKQGVEDIYLGAFKFCDIDEIILPDSLTLIGYEAFDSSKIKTMYIPDSVTKLNNRPFCNCKNLTTVRLSNSLKDISYECFLGCIALESVEIPELVQKLNGACFQGCQSLTSVLLPANVTYFGGGAFSGCPNINLTFAEGSPFFIDTQFLITKDNVSQICQFIGNTPNTTLTIPATVKKIADRAFYGNKCIKKVVFEKDSLLTYIGQSAFDSSSLEEFEFPPNLETSDYCAFSRCKLKKAVFGTKVKSIGSYGFAFNGNLESVVFQSPNTDINIWGYAFVYCASINEIILPEGLKVLTDDVFGYAKGVKTIVLPSTLEEIGRAAFWETTLDNVTFNTGTAENPLKPNLKVIRKCAFQLAKSLTKFPFIEGLESIEDQAFEETSLQSVLLPKSIKNITDKCFLSCKNLERFEVIEGSDLNYIGNGVFQNCLKMKTIIVNNDYFTTVNNGLYNSEKSIIIYYPPASTTHFLCLQPEIILISPCTFAQCKNLRLVVMPDNCKLEKIGAEAFLNCVNLKSINMPDTVYMVGGDAFKNCKMLTCGLMISKNNLEFRRNLVKVAGMPEKCLNPCDWCKTMAPQQQRLTKPKVFSLFTLLLLSSNQ